MFQIYYGSNNISPRKSRKKTLNIEVSKNLIAVIQFIAFHEKRKKAKHGHTIRKLNNENRSYYVFTPQTEICKIAT